MKTLRILAWVLFFSISGTGNAAITINATSATVERLIGVNDDVDSSRNPRYDESIGETHQTMLGRVLFGLASQYNLVAGTGDIAVDHPLPVFDRDSYVYRLALHGDSFLRRKYAIILGTLPDGRSTMASEINTRGPEPDKWAILVLGIGSIVYQMRPRNTLRATNLSSDI